MANRCVTPLKDFCPKDVAFSKKTPSQATGRYFCYVNSSSGTKLYLQTPMMVAPFGVSKDTFGPTGQCANSTDSKAGSSGMKMTLSFGGEDAEVEICRQKLIELEDHIIDYAVENSVDWFGKPLTREIVESMYFPIVKKDPKMQWPDTFTVKIATSMKDGSVQLDKLYCYEPDAEVPTMEDIPVDHIMEHIVRRSKVQVIFTLSQVYFTGSRGFGVSMKASVIRFVANSVGSELSFVDPTPVVMKPKAAELIPSSTVEPNLICSSDLSDEEDSTSVE